MNWFTKLLPPKVKASTVLSKKRVPEGIWVKCSACSGVIYRMELGEKFRGLSEVQSSYAHDG